MKKRSHKFIDLTGQKFHYLTVISFHSIQNRLTTWNCICICGKEKINYGAILRAGRVKSCGCYKGERTLKPGKASMHFIYEGYQRRAKKKNLPFELTKDEFEKITSSNCYYCGVEPKQYIKCKRYNGGYFYNGIDRTDNSMGYTLGNSVACCGLCNQMKMTESIDSFYEHLLKIVKNRGLI